MTLVSASTGERTVDAGDFFHDDGIDYLTRRPDEILAAIELDDYSGWRMTYEKLRRRGSFDFPILGVAAAVKLNDGRRGGRAARAGRGRLVARRPVTTRLATRLAAVRRKEAIQAVAAEAYKGARPLDNTDLHYAWRKKMARVYVERALSKYVSVS